MRQMSALASEGRRHPQNICVDIFDEEMCVVLYEDPDAINCVLFSFGSDATFA